MKILVVEDDDVTREMVQRQLEWVGYEVAVAANGEQAWDMLQREPIRLVITDWMMPKMDGLELIRRIRNSGRASYTYIILLTAKGEKEDLMVGLEAGADDYLAKPAGKDELRARVAIGRRVVEAEQAVQETSEHDYRVLAEFVFDYAYVFEVNEANQLILRWATDAFIDLIGMNLVEATGVGKDAYGLIYPDDIDTVKEHWRRLLVLGQADSCEFRIVVRGGEVVWLRNHARPVWDAVAGRTVRVDGVLRDITERKQSEQILRRYTEWLELLQEIDRAILGAIQSSAEIADVVLARLERLIPYDRASIWVIDEADAVCLAVNIKDEGLAVLGPAGRRIPLGQVAAEVELLRQEQALVVQDGLALDVPSESDARLMAAGLRSYFRVPLSAGGVLVGWMSVGAKTANAFDDEHVTIGFEIAKQITIAIHQAQLHEDTERQVKELSILHAVSLAVAEANDEDELFERVTEIVGRALYTQMFGVLKIDETTGAVYPHRSYQRKYRKLITEDLKLGEGVVGQVAQTGQPWRIPDVRNEPGYVNAYAEVLSELCVPIRIGERVVGVIDAQSDQLAAFDVTDERLLTTIAGHVGTAMEKLQSFEREHRRAAELATLHQVSMAVTSASDEDVLIEEISRIIGERLYPQSFGVLLLDSEQRVLHRHGSYQTAKPNKERFSIEIERGVIGYVARTGEPKRVADVREEPLYVGINTNTRSELCVPIRADERVLGVINVENPELNAFSASDERLLATIAGQLGTALEKLRLFEQERQRAAELSTMLTVAMAVSSSLDLERVLQIVADQMMGVLGVSRYTLSRWDREADAVVTWLHSANAGGREIEEVGAVYSLADYPATRAVLENRQPCAISVGDPETDRAEVALMKAWGVQSLLMVPLAAGDRVIGLMELAEIERERVFTDSEIYLVGTLADQAAVAIQQAQLHEATQRQLRELSILHETAVAVVEALDEDELIGRVTRVVGEALYSQTFGVLLLDEGSEVLYPHPTYHYSYEMVLAPGAGVAIGEGLIGQAAQSGWPLRVADVRQESNYVMAYAETRAELCVPVKVGEQVVGVIDAQSDQVGAFGVADEQLLVTIAGQLGAALDKLRLFEQERQRTSELATMLTVATAVASSVALDDMLPVVADQMVRAIGASRCTLLRWDAGRDALVVWLHSSSGDGVLPDDVGAVYLLDDYPAARRVLETGEPHALSLNNPRGGLGEIAVMEAQGFKSVLMVALAAGDQVIGLVGLEEVGYERQFTAREIELVQALANQVAVAIQQAQLFEDTRRQVQELMILHDVATVTSRALDEDELIGEVTQIVGEAIYTQNFGVLLLDEARGLLWPHLSYHYSYNRTMETDLGVKLGMGLIGGAAQTDEPVRVGDVRVDSAYIVGFSETLSEMCVPVRIGNRVIGVLNAESSQLNAFSAADERLLITIAGQLGTALEKLRLLANERQRRKELASMLTVATTVSSPLELEEVLLVVAEQLALATGASGCMLSRWNKDDDTVVMWAHAHLPEDARPNAVEAVYRLADYPATRRVLRNNQPFQVTVDDSQGDPDEVDLMRALALKSLLMMPLAIGDEVVGLIELYDTGRTRKFTGGEVRLAEALADQAATAIERARAFELLHQSEVRYRAVSESISDFAYSFDVDENNRTMLTWVTEDSYTRLTGWTMRETEAQGGWREFIYKKDRARAIKSIEQTFLGQPTEVEFRIVTKSGELRWLRNYTRPVWDEVLRRVVRIDGGAQDITERKQIEESLRKSEERLRQAQQVAHVGSWYWDAADNQWEWSDEVYRICGLEQGAFTPTFRDFLEVVIPEDRERMTQFRTEIFEGQGVNYGIDYRIIRPSGEVRHVELYGAATRDVKGGLISLLGAMMDVTERVEAEQALRLRDRALESAGDGIVLVDVTKPEQLITYVNKAYERTTGYRAEEVVGKPSHFLQGEDRDQPGVKVLRDAVQEGREGRAVLRNYRKDGSMFWHEIAVSPVADRSGIITHYVGIQNDITERLKQEQALRESEERLREAQRLARLGSWRWDIDTDRVDFSDEMYRICEITPDTFTATSEDFRALIHPDDQELVRQHIEAALHGNAKYDLDYRLVLPSRDIRYVHDQGVVKRDVDSRPVSMVGTLMDITERKQSEVARNRAAEQVERGARQLAALNQMGQAIIASLDLSEVLAEVIDRVPPLVGAEGVVVLLAEGDELVFAAVSGSGAVGLKGQRMPIHSGVAGEVMRTERPVWVSGAQEDSQTEIYREAEQDYSTQSLLAVPLHLRGNVIGVLEAAHSQPQFFDENDLRMLESTTSWVATAIQNAQLYGDLKRSLRKEQSTRAQLVQADKLASMGRMVASVAHELNNPLQIINNSLFLVKQSQSSNATANKFLDIASSEIIRLTSLVEQLRQVYRPQPGKQIEFVSLPMLLGELNELVMPHLRRKKVQLHLMATAETYLVYGNPDQLRQVFLNLSLNAADAMEPKGGILTVSFVGPDDETGQVGIAFRDTGVGIDPEVLPNLFDPFFSTKTSGTGLGLAICYDIVHNHAGQIEVESEPGKGATFIVWLPLAQDAL